MGVPRAFRKGGGDREYGGALHALALKKQGEAQVVANSEADREALPFCQHQLFPRPRIFPFIEARAVGQVYGEEMELAIGGGKAPVAIEVERRVVGAGAIQGFREAAKEQLDLEALGEVLSPGEEGTGGGPGADGR